METQISSLTAAVSTAFVTEEESAKLTEMLTLSVDDLERVSGGKPPVKTCCHIGSPFHQ